MSFQISLKPENRRNASALYNPFTIKELQKKYPYNHWVDNLLFFNKFSYILWTFFSHQLTYFNEILPSVSQVTEDETIIVYDVPFFDQLDELLQKTPKRAIANYIMWRVAADSTNYLTDKLRKRQLGYAGALIGQQSEEPRWKECTDLVTSNFKIAVASTYVRKYFNQDSKAVALEMVNSILDEFEEILKKVTWMDQATREAAMLKAKGIVKHIGYPDELMDDKKLIEYYKKVSINEEKYLESILSRHALKTDQEYEKLRESVNKTDWKTHSNAAVVNAAYSAIENSIRKSFKNIWKL